MSHTHMGHATRTQACGHTYTARTSKVSPSVVNKHIRNVTLKATDIVCHDNVTHTDESCHTYICVRSHKHSAYLENRPLIRQVTHPKRNSQIHRRFVSRQCRTYGVMSHTHMGHATRTHASYHTYTARTSKIPLSVVNWHIRNVTLKYTDSVSPLCHTYT